MLKGRDVYRSQSCVNLVHWNAEPHQNKVGDLQVKVHASRFVKAVFQGHIEIDVHGEHARFCTQDSLRYQSYPALMYVKQYTQLITLM